MLTLHAADSDQESVFLQNKERAYSQRLQLYQEAQGRQAQLVEKLQTKVSNDKVNGYEEKKKKEELPFGFVVHLLLHHQVLQYKKRCGELEELALEKTSDLEKMRLLVCLGRKFDFYFTPIFFLTIAPKLQHLSI